MDLMDRGRCGSNGEEKMGSLKKKEGHLFSSILPISWFLRESCESRERRGEKWKEIRGKCLVEADKEERAGSYGKRKEGIDSLSTVKEGAHSALAIPYEHTHTCKDEKISE